MTSVASNTSSQKFCGLWAPDLIISAGSEMVLTFHSDYSVSGRGFSLHYEAIGTAELGLVKEHLGYIMNATIA